MTGVVSYISLGAQGEEWPWHSVSNLKNRVTNPNNSQVKGWCLKVSWLHSPASLGWLCSPFIQIHPATQWATMSGPLFTLCSQANIGYYSYHQVNLTRLSYLPTGYMVGSETKYPAWTHQAHFDYFLITFTIYPQFTHPNTHWVNFEYFYKVPTQIPTDRQAGYIQKVPTKNPVGKCWSNYKQNPWFLSQFTPKRTRQILCERTPWFLSKMTL